MGGDPSEGIDDLIAEVSIHAPAWGATKTVKGLLFFYTRFNPRPRMGGDMFSVPGIRIILVSIHAPAWGAT